MTTTLTITQVTTLPDGQVERESVDLPMPDVAAGRDLLSTIRLLLASAPGGGLDTADDPNRARIELASGDRITIRVVES